MADAIVTHATDPAGGTQVLKHPAFGRPPVKNIRAPGRKKGTASLQAARYKRWLAQQPAAAPEPFPVAIPPRLPGVYCYPKTMLTQAYFCRSGTGVWHAPSMSLDMLVNERFVSPMGALLDQLEAEGHNVSGARAEWLAFRELARGLNTDVEALSLQMLRLQHKRPLAAAMLIEDGTK